MTSLVNGNILIMSSMKVVRIATCKYLTLYEPDTQADFISDETIKLLDRYINKELVFV